MKLRWSFRAANDRGPQAESRVLFEAPKRNDYSKSGRFLCSLKLKVFMKYLTNSILNVTLYIEHRCIAVLCIFF